MLRGTLKTTPIVATSRVYVNELEALADRPVGPFLLYIDGSLYGLAVGNIINGSWAWKWAGLRKDTKTMRGLLLDTEVETTKLPAERGIIGGPTMYNLEHEQNENYVDLTDEDDEDEEGTAPVVAAKKLTTQTGRVKKLA